MSKQLVPPDLSQAEAQSDSSLQRTALGMHALAATDSVLIPVVFFSICLKGHSPSFVLLCTCTVYGYMQHTNLALNGCTFLRIIIFILSCSPLPDSPSVRSPASKSSTAKGMTCFVGEGG